MQLEKAHGGTGEAGTVGWISSNDVTLFAMVLVVAIALFLQANLNKRAKVNAQLTDDKELLRVRLASLDNTLKDRDDELRRRATDLAEREAKLRETEQSLNRTLLELQAIQQSKSDLDATLALRLKEIQELTEALKKLQITRDELMEEKTLLAEEKVKLAEKKANVDQNLAELSRTLAQKLKDLEELQRERELLNKKSEALAERVKLLERQLGDTEINLNQTKSTKDAELAELQELLRRALATSKDKQLKLDETEKATQAAEAKADLVNAKLRRAGDMYREVTESRRLLQLQVDALKAQLANVLDQLEKTKVDLQDQQSKGKSIHRQLVGLNGRLKRVAFVVDSSGSMNEGGRWTECQRIITAWLEHLDMEECGLIVFSSNVRVFPADGTLLKVRGEEGKANRTRLTNYLASIKPDGWTNTLDAMRKAYQYRDLDTIMLFSDGAPTNSTSNKFDPASAEQIFALCRQNSKVPVNTIGLGNYFDKDLSTFLRAVSVHTGGTFLGR